jgi:hypothetical protein
MDRPFRAQLDNRPPSQFKHTRDQFEYKESWIKQQASGLLFFWIERGRRTFSDSMVRSPNWSYRPFMAITASTTARGFSYCIA